MANPRTTTGQGVFTWGIDPVARLMVDSTKDAATTAEIVAGYPIALDSSADAVDSGATWAAADLFYGVTSSNINTLFGRTSLGEHSAAKANAELMGRYTIRRSVFLNSAGVEVTANPFGANDGTALWPTVANIGAKIHAIAIAVNDANDAFNGTTMLRWVVTATGSNDGFENVAVITGVTRDSANSEVEIMVNGTFANYQAGAV